MLDLYKEDEEKIVKIVEGVRVKFMNGGEVNGEKLSRLHNELTGRLEDAGYICTVDVTPLLDGFPPIVSVDGKQEPQAWDFDKKAFEIKKRQKGDDPKIEGMV